MVKLEIRSSAEKWCCEQLAISNWQLAKTALANACNPLPTEQ
jgi:hypothetical protein